jgi:TRAP-type transport system periplasmic protein
MMTVNKNSKFTLIMFVFLVMMFVMGACTSEEPDAVIDNDVESDDVEVVDLILAHTLAPSAASAQAMEVLKDILLEKSNGQIRLTVHHSGALGEEPDMNENVNSGALDMNYTSPGSLGDLFLSDIQILDAPYLFEDQDHAMKVYNESTVLQDMADELLESSNIKILDWWYRAPRHLFVTELVEHPDDLRGLNIRSPQIEVYLEAIQALGAEATPVPYHEVYGAIQTGIVKGVEGPLDLSWGMGFHEVTNYLVLIGWNQGFGPIIINNNKFESLSEDHQRILQEAVLEAGQLNYQITMEGIESLLSQYEEAGLEIIDPDLAPFINAGREAIPKIEHVWNSPGLFEKFQEVLQ